MMYFWNKEAASASTMSLEWNNHHTLVASPCKDTHTVLESLDRVDAEVNVRRSREASVVSRSIPLRCRPYGELVL